MHRCCLRGVGAPLAAAGIRRAVKRNFSARFDQLTIFGGAIFQAPDSVMPPYSRGAQLAAASLRGACLYGPYFSGRPTWAQRTCGLATCVSQLQRLSLNRPDSTVPLASRGLGPRGERQPRTSRFSARLSSHLTVR